MSRGQHTATWNLHDVDYINSVTSDFEISWKPLSLHFDQLFGTFFGGMHFHDTIF